MRKQEKMSQTDQYCVKHGQADKTAWFATRLKIQWSQFVCTKTYTYTDCRSYLVELCSRAWLNCPSQDDLLRDVAKKESQYKNAPSLTEGPLSNYYACLLTEACRSFHCEGRMYSPFLPTTSIHAHHLPPRYCLLCVHLVTDSFVSKMTKTTMSFFSVRDH